MRELVVEILLRLIKPALATVLGMVIYLAASAAGATHGPELVLLSWLCGAAFVLLVESGPI